jgi:hypothetical protein
MDQLLRAVLAIEEQARQIAADAETRSREIIEGAEAERSALECRAGTEAEHEARAIRAALEAEVEHERARILAAADEQARLLTERAAARLPEAIELVVRQVLRWPSAGEPEAEHAASRAVTGRGQ